MKERGRGVSVIGDGRRVTEEGGKGGVWVTEEGGKGGV